MSGSAPPSTAAPARPRAGELDGRAAVLALAVAWWAGFNLRSVLLSVPPLLDPLRADLHLSYTAAGLLTSLPLVVLGALAFPGAALVRRWGAHPVVALGLLGTALGAALRALPAGGAAPVFAGTLLLAAGIAVAQPGLPVMVQAWFPRSVQRASTVVTLGLITGEIAGAGMTGPAILGPLGWRGGFAVWAAPVAVAAVAWVAVPGRGPAGMAPRGRPLRPLLRSPQLWWVVVFFGAQSLVYFAANTWIPATVRGGSGSAAASLDLTLLNLVMLPATLALTLTRRPFVRSRAFYATGSLLALTGAVGWMVSADSLGPLWVLLMGAATSTAFAGLLAYWPSVAAPEDVAASTAMMLAFGYLAAFLGPLLGGTARDALHTQWAAFLPVAVSAAVMLACSVRLPAARDAG
jgi:MFS transporter, CP family, cyanate transporter